MSDLFTLEEVEARLFLSASHLDHARGVHHPATHPAYVYTESNDPDPGQNAILGYRRDPHDGSLTLIGTFPTGGTGQANPGEAIGPDDSDQEVIVSSDRRFLLAVNQGSDSIAVFRIHHNGSLRLAGTFASGGVQPVSLGLSADHLYVANRGDSAVGHPGTVAPNYTAFRLSHDGKLRPIPNSTITFPIDTSPAQTLISRDGKFVFADTFAVPGSAAPLGNTISPFRIAPDGSLHPAPGGAVGAPVSPPLLLGTALHPTRNILYAGFTGAAKIGVYEFDKSGTLSFVTSIADQGAAPCWCTVSPDGQFLYVANTGTDSVGVFSLADPLHPAQVQEFHLAGPLTGPSSPAGKLDTNAFQLAVDPSGKSLYVINHSVAANHDFPEGNALHTLAIAADGTVSEKVAPVIFSTTHVPATAHPQGLAIVSFDEDEDHGRGAGKHRR